MEPETSGLPVAVLPPHEPSILCVDDEPNILAALKRTLRGAGCPVRTAASGAQALEEMRRSPADVVISDMRMPHMDGAELLERMRNDWPASVRILLTGHADIANTVAAINRGRIFRYIDKPWNDEDLLAAVHQGLELVALQRDKERLEELTLSQNLELRALNECLEQRVQERTEELGQANKKLKQSFLTSIRVFSNLLEMRGGQLLGHGRRVADLARRMAQTIDMGAQEQQDIFVAGLLHDIGLIGLRDAILVKPVARLQDEELLQYRQHPLLGEQSLMPLDDMQPVAVLIHAHHERHDGRGYPDGRCEDEIPVGARILAIIDTFDELQNGHLGGAKPSATEARLLIQQGRGTQFDPELVDVFLQLTEPQHRRDGPAWIVSSAELEINMVLASDLVSPQGVLLLTAGQRLTDPLIRRIRNFEQKTGEPFRLHIHGTRGGL